MGRQSLGLSQQCIKSTSVSITPHLGPIGASYSWKHVPSDGLSLNSAPAYQVLGGSPTAIGHGLFCPPSPWWGRRASGTSARLFSAAGQHCVNAQPLQMGVQGEMQRPRLDCHGSSTPLTFYSTQGLGNAPPPQPPPTILQNQRVKCPYRWNRWTSVLEISTLLPNGITFNSL